MYGAPSTRPCVIIPVYNHGKTLDPVITAIRAGIDIPIMLIDDGSDGATKRCLQDAVSAYQGLTLIGLAKNSGKGAAVMRGINAARESGFTHALQIDADGQHDAGRIPFFLAEAAAHPEAVICGLPRFDRSAPASRLWGRKISNGWAAIVTLSKALPDVLCGFRVYPVEPFWALAHSRPINRRMGFDTDILVRLYWRNIPVRFYPLRVIYPENGRSHFRLVRDNLQLAWTFTRLFLGMIPRLPALLNRRRVRGGMKPDRGHWASQPELTRSYWQFKALIAMVRLLPRGVLSCCAFPISFFYYLAAKRARRESRRFLDAVNAQVPGGKRRSVYRHFASFALCLVEKAAAWGGRISGEMIRYQDDAIESLVEDINERKGAFLLCSHLGNAEMLRALADFGRTRAGRAFPVVSIVDYSMAEQFGRMLREINPGSMNHLISARNIGVETLGRLEECLDAGGLVVSAGDRTAPEGGRNRRFLIDFLGRPAPFPMGSFHLASLLKRNVYFVFALRRKTFSLSWEYDFHVVKGGIDFDCPRREREARIERLARSYAETLERLCKAYPYQWYNYYDFWEAPDA